MNITIGRRGSGRTTELIKACAVDKGSVIVSPTHRNAEYIANLAKQMGLDIPEPITFEALLKGNPYDFGKRPTGYYIDNLDLALRSYAGASIKEVTIEGGVEDILWLDPTQN